MGPVDFQPAPNVSVIYLGESEQWKEGQGPSPRCLQDSWCEGTQSPPVIGRKGQLEEHWKDQGSRSQLCSWTKPQQSCGRFLQKKHKAVRGHLEVDGCEKV